MSMRKPNGPLDPYAPRDGRLLPPPHLPVAMDWGRWLRNVERKRKLLIRVGERGWVLPVSMLTRITLGSFALEGIDVTVDDVADTIRRRSRRGGVRSRTQQRVRNHVAIMLAIEQSLQRGESLKPAAVLRWYTMLSNGLCPSMPADAKLLRLEQFVRRINCPHRRLQPAVQEIVSMHMQALADELVPSFSGIVARLLLHYHLGRCGLPPIAFDPAIDAPLLLNEPQLLGRVLTLVDESFDLLIGQNLAISRFDAPPAPLPKQSIA